MPRVSVVVPIHNVEAYLAECLQSIASQTFAELDVVMVDDGSTDGSATIAERFAERDRRFRLIRRPNGGLSRARNTGVDAASGDHLAFVDSDDVLPHDAYERLLGALTASGSDFASGNVRRLSHLGLEQAGFLAKAFAQTRLKTHVERCRPLISDRTAWNKLFRRDFWDEHGLRFPDGRVHEDIPVMIPAHFTARTVDALAAPVYYWRQREDGSRSITQRRLELGVMRDRLSAIEEVRAFLARHASSKARRWYDEAIVADDLRLHLELLHAADAQYRTEFAERVNAILDMADPRIFDSLKAINRLEWHLLRRGLVDEAAEVARFHAEEAADTPPIRRRGRYYGDYPFRSDPALRIPRSVFRLGRPDSELALAAHLDGLRVEDGLLKIRGHAHIAGLGARDPETQRIGIGALRRGRWRRIRMHLRPARMRTTARYRPDLIRTGGRRLAWAGFEAEIDPRQLGTRRSRAGVWEVFAHVRTGFVIRRRAKFVIVAPELLPAVHSPGGDARLVKASVSTEGSLTIDVRTRWVRLDAAHGHDEEVVLSGVARLPPDGEPELELRRRSDDLRLRFPIAASEGGFRAVLRLRDLRAAGPPLEAEARSEPAAQQVWELSAVSGGHRCALALPGALDRAIWTVGGRELLLVATPGGDATLIERDPLPIDAPQDARAEPQLAPAAARTTG